MTRYIPIKEFRALGFVQELNRRFLHPCGLALEVVVESTGEEKLGGIWDYRDDPEGIIFVDVPDTEKAATVERLLTEKEEARKRAFGWVIQPLDGSGSLKS